MDNSLTMRMMHYMQNYDVAYTYVHNTGETQIITDPNGKVCRFCGRRYPDVKFRKKAHAVSELMGNKEFVLRNECDTCNEEFGNLLEDELSKYMGLSRTISQIHGKNGVPTYRSKDKKKRIEFDPELGILIKVCKDCVSGATMEQSDGIDDSGFTETVGNTMIIHAVRDTYTPLAVYKSFVKMALSLLPYEYMPNFLDTTAWIKEHSHVLTRFHDLRQYGIMLERFIPGVPYIPMRATGFIRRNDTILLPYYIFYLEFANFSYQISVPCPAKDMRLKKMELVPVPSLDEQIGLLEWCRLHEQGQQPDFETFESEHIRKFGKSEITVKDLRSTDKTVDEPLVLAVHFDTIEGGKAPPGTTVEDYIEAERAKIREGKNNKAII